MSSTNQIPVQNILVGSASWTDKTLIACGRFYPPGVSTPEARLRHYASIFPMVEVDSSYYAMPTAANSERWAGRTPDDFVFNLKAFRLFTGHQTSPASLPRDIRDALPASSKNILYYADVPAELRFELWRRFTQALAPLRAAGKLAAVHFQFPPWLVCNRHGRAHVAHCVEMMQGFRLATEFRHISWFDGAVRTQETLALQRELGTAHVVVDSPQGFDNTVPAVWAATTPQLGIVRLHGRNAGTWNVKGAVASSSRFNYEYGDDELQELVPPMLGLAATVDMLQVVFNTNHEDQGQVNGRKLMRQLARSA